MGIKNSRRPLTPADDRNADSRPAKAYAISDEDGQKLLDSFICGEERAFDQIIKAYSAMMFGVFLRWFKLSLEDAQDLHQEVLLQLIIKADTIRNLRPWLLGAAINQAKKRIRRLVRNRKLSELFAQEAIPSSEHDDRDTLDLVERGLAQISAKDRELLRLMFYEGLSYQETAKRLGHPIGSIGPLRGRALNRFAGIVAKLEAPDLADATVH